MTTQNFSLTQFILAMIVLMFISFLLGIYLPVGPDRILTPMQCSTVTQDVVTSFEGNEIHRKVTYQECVTANVDANDVKHLPE